MASLGNHPKYGEIAQENIPFLARNHERLLAGVDPLGDESELYTMTVGQRMTHIACCMDHLHMFLFFLTDYSAPKRLEKNGISRSDYLRYHIEGYFTRLSSLLDSGYLLVNAVLELGLPEQRRELVPDMQQTEISPIAEPLARLKQAIEPVKPESNRIAQGDSYMDKELWMLRVSELDTQGEIGKHRFILTESYLQSRKMEYKKQIEEVEGILSALFDAVYDEWQARRRRKVILN